MRALILSLGIAAAAGPVLAQQTPAGASTFPVTGSVPQVCNVGQPVHGAQAPINFVGLQGNGLAIQQLVDPTTLQSRAASIEILFAGACNYPHRLVIESQNNGLWRNTLGATAAEGFSSSIPYSVTVNWGDQNSRFEVDAATRAIRNLELASDAAAGDVSLRLEIQQGASGGGPNNAPLLAGAYSDTLRVTVEPQ